jgi:hypothetical protein
MKRGPQAASWVALAVTLAVGGSLYVWKRVRDQTDPKATTVLVIRACDAALANPRGRGENHPIKTTCVGWKESAAAHGVKIHDQWGRVLMCEMRGGMPSLISYGADGQLGGGGSDLDIRGTPDPELGVCGLELPSNKPLKTGRPLGQPAA